MRKLAAIVVLVLAGCGGGGGGGGEPATVATPVFSPAAGTYGAVQNVTITCATAGAAIHYTIDGTTPTASSPTYTAAVPVTTTATTIKAMATAARREANRERPRSRAGSALAARRPKAKEDPAAAIE